jgi:hypothetical protein
MPWASRGNKRRIHRTRTKEEWTIKEGHFTAIVTPQTWEEANRKITTRDKHNHPPRKNATWLSGLLFCSGCNEKIYAFCQKTNVYGYHCQTYARQYRDTGTGEGCKCGHNVIRHPEAEKIITDKLAELGIILDRQGNPNDALAAAFLKVKTGLDISEGNTRARLETARTIKNRIRDKAEAPKNPPKQ